MIKHYISLVESEQWSDKKLWIACSKEDARRLSVQGPSPTDKFSDSPQGAKDAYEDVFDDGGEIVLPVILEFRINPKVAINDIKDTAGDGITVHNPKAVTFKWIWEGVINDAFASDNNPKLHELDEIALGGLARCTAVTCNALLKHFGKQGITLGDVPETDVGVLQILSKGGLIYKPVVGAAGRSVNQFVNLNQRGAFYIVTPGHAMAVVDKNLFDAENRGPDGRQIIQAYQIGRR